MELIENLRNVWVIPLGEGSFIWVYMSWIVNAALWLLDLYPLVKKKSLRETTAVMLLPGTIFVFVAVLSSFMLGITRGPDLQNGAPFMEKRICVELLILALLFMTMWFLAMRLRGSRNAAWKRRLLWALSYVPDLIIVVCILAVSLFRLIGGVSLISELEGLSIKLGFTSYNIFAWLYVYGITTLLIRFGLLLVAIFARLISMRIPVGAYRESSHPMRRFLWYAAICQNAYLRGVVAFFIPMILFFVSLFVMEGSSSYEDIIVIMGVIFFVGAEGFTGILITLKPIMENLGRFRKWGDRKSFLEQFCREYFNETPIYRTMDYTVTRHFLVDERSTASIYYLGMLKSWRCCQRISQADYEKKRNTQWSQPYTVDPAQRSGWQWEISFLGGDICIIEREDPSADMIIKRLQMYWDSYLLGERRAQQSGVGQYDAQNDRFNRWFRVGVALTLLFMVILYVICRAFAS